MARIISFAALVVIFLVIAGLFYQVMAGFLLPMFLALLLVIMFRPLDDWYGRRLGGRQSVAAGLTTLTILFIVLIPFIAIFVEALSDSSEVYKHIKPTEMSLQKLSAFAVRNGARFGLHLDEDDLKETISVKAREWLYPMARDTTKIASGFFMGLVVMLISLYYFFADGREMVRAITRISPLDARYTTELVDQFVGVSRAVVVATILSAVIQGLLATAGFYLAGFGSIFLLFMVVTLLSMIPFIGSPTYWIAACGYLYFYEGRIGATIAMGIYATIILCTVDNIVRLIVLRGHANVHPLLALLSVLGGMQAMGAVGIFVGPMVVALLQTLLNILHKEILALGVVKEPEPGD